jgi:hypothetical protein
MEISKLSDGVKIKSKLATLGVNPFNAKGVIDAAILLEKTYDKKTIDGEPLILVGPGEYEIKGVKINGFGQEIFGYTARIDSVRVSIIKASGLSKTKDIPEESDIVIIETDMLPDQKAIAGLNARVIVLYGTNAQETAKNLGKEVSPISKYVITKDKLPSEMEVIILG